MAPNLKLWNAMILAAVAIMAGLLVFELVAPQPTYKARSAAKVKADDVAREQEYQMRQDFAKKRAEIDAQVWPQSPEGVGALVLDRVTNMARTQGLGLTSFRPQKQDELGELNRLAYVMTLEGPYPKLLAMVRDLEAPANRLAVHMLQVASADEGSDLVTATVGLSAYVEDTKKETETKNGKA